MDWPPIALTPSQDSTACHMHARCGAGKSSKMPRSIIFSSLVLPLFFCVCEKASSRTTYKKRGLGPVKRCRLALLPTYSYVLVPETQRLVSSYMQIKYFISSTHGLAT